MKNTLTVLALAAIFFASCSNSNAGNNQSVTLKPIPGTSDGSKVSTPTVLDSMKAIRDKNEAAAKAQEIPVGEQTFSQLVSYVNTHGFSFTAGEKNVNCGRQVTFFDSHKNRHAFLAIKTDAFGVPSTNGIVSKIVVYGYKKGIKDQDHFFGYDIDAKTVHAYMLKYDGTWFGADEARFGYTEFLAKVEKEKK